MATNDDPRALLAALRELTNRPAFWNQLTAEQTAELKRALGEEERQIEQEWRSHAAQAATNERGARLLATGKPKAAAKKKPQSKEFADRRSRWRLTDLKIIVRYSAEVLGKRTTLKALAALFPNRDVNNPADVTGADVGNALALTVERVFKFEDLASAYAREQKYAKPSFAFKTVTACRAEAEELGRKRRQRRNQRVSERRREERAEQRSNGMLQTATATPAGRQTLGGLMAEQKARTRAQCDALYDAFGDGERTPKDLMAMAAVRRHLAWRDISPNKFYQTVVTRLDMMEADGRIKTVRRDPGPRGSRVRVMRRI